MIVGQRIDRIRMGDDVEVLGGLNAGREITSRPGPLAQRVD